MVLGWGGLGGGWAWFVERDAEGDLDLPFVDLDAFDKEAHESLALSEVELVEGGGDGGGEVFDSVTQAVVGGEVVALG